jgi:hypothetical protein
MRPSDHALTAGGVKACPRDLKSTAIDSFRQLSTHPSSQPPIMKNWRTTQPFFDDFRVMLDKLHKELDTPANSG